MPAGTRAWTSLEILLDEELQAPDFGTSIYFYHDLQVSHLSGLRHTLEMQRELPSDKLTVLTTGARQRAAHRKGREGRSLHPTGSPCRLTLSRLTQQAHHVCSCSCSCSRGAEASVKFQEHIAPQT